MILRNFFLQVLNREKQRNPNLESGPSTDFQVETATAIETSKEKVKQAEQTEHFEAAFRAINSVFKVMTNESTRGGVEVNEEEKAEIEMLLHDLIDAQLDARILATVPETEVLEPTRELEDIEFHGMFLHEIATNHGMDEATLIQFNKDHDNTFSVIAGPTGETYCLKEETVLIPNELVTAAERQTELEETQRELISESGAVRLEDLITERDQELRSKAQEQLSTIREQRSELHESVMGNYRSNLQGKKVKLPKFLRGNFRRTGNEEWAELLKRAGQDGNPASKRLTLLIDDKPLSWKPSQFRQVIREKRNKILSFDDITRHKTGEKEGEFFAKYEATKEELEHDQPKIEKAELKINEQFEKIDGLQTTLGEQIEDHPELRRQKNESYEAWQSRVSTSGVDNATSIITTIQQLKTAYDKLRDLEDSPVLTQAKELEADIAFREELMVQAFQVLQAMREATEGPGIEQHAFRRYEEEVTTTRAVAGKTAIYDIDDLAFGSVIAVEEGNEGLGTTNTMVSAIQDRFKDMGVRNRYLNKMDEGFALRLVIFSCGIDNLIRTGSIVKDSTDGSLYLTELPDNFNTTNLTEVAESFNLKRGVLEFDIEAATTFKLEMLAQDDSPKGKEAYARALATRVFQNEGDTVTMEDIAAGERATYKKTAKHLLASVGDAESALEDLLTHRRYFDTDSEGVERLNEEELMEDMQYFLDSGIDNFFQDTELDIISVLEDLGIDMTRAVKKEIRKLDRQINRNTREAARKRMRIDNKLTRQEKRGTESRAQEILELERDIDGLRAENEEWIEARMSILSPKYTNLLKAELTLTGDTSEISAYQKIFIHNGYAINRGRRLEDRVDATNKAQVEAMLTQYGDDPVAGPILYQIADADPNVRADQLQAVVAAIYDGLRRGTEIQAQMQETNTGDSRYIFGVGGMLNTKEGEGVTGGRAGLYIPIQLPIEGLSISIGIGGGFSEKGGYEGGAGAGMSYSAQLDPAVSLTTSLHFGAGFKGPDTYIGATLTETVTVTSGIWDMSASGTGGFKFSLKDGVVLGGAVTVGVGVNMDRYRDRQVDKAQFRTCTDILTATHLTKQQRVNAIAEVPGFDAISDELAQVSPTVREQILLEMFQDYANHVGNVAISELTPPPITGFKVTMMPYPPFIIPTITFAFAGKAKLYFAVPGDPNELYTDSNQSLQQAIARDMRNMEGEPIRITDTGLLDRTSVLMMQIADPSGQPYMTGHQEFPISIQDILDGNLEARNEILNASGINLSPGTGEARGLLNLDIHGIRGNVDVRPDPSMDARLIVGNKKPPTSRDLYLAINQMSVGSNLVITREEYITRHKDGGEYKSTRITIRAVDPAQAERTHQRNYFQNYEDLRGPMLSFRNDSNLDIDSTNSDNLLIWDEYLAKKDALTSAGLTTLGLDEYEADLERLHDILFNDESADMRSNELEEPAIKFFEANMELCSEATIFDEDMGADIDALKTKIREDIGITDISELEMEFILTVIRKQTYAHPSSPRNAEQREAYRKRNDDYFRRILSEQFSPEIATRMLADIEGNKDATPMAIPAAAEIYTVVGRNGAQGLRADTMQAVDLLNMVDYSDDPYMKMQILKGLREVPEDDREFMRTSIAVNTLDNYYLLKSPEKGVQMKAIYENPELLSRPKYKAVFDEFKELTLQLRAAEMTGEQIVVKTDYGVEFVVEMSPQILGGSLGYCDNPTVVVNERMKLGIPEGVTLSQLKVNLQELPGKVQKDIYQFFASGSVTREKEPTTPPPPEEEPPEEDTGDKGPKGVNTDIKIDPADFDRDWGAFEGGGQDAPGEESGIF